MKINFTFLIAVFASVTVMAQTGIGNSNPRGLLDVNDQQEGNTTGGLVLPTTGDLTTIKNPQDNGAPVAGTLIYDKTEGCIKVYTTKWSGCITDGSGGGVIPPIDPPVDPPIGGGTGGSLINTSGSLGQDFLVYNNNQLLLGRCNGVTVYLLYHGIDVIFQGNLLSGGAIYDLFIDGIKKASGTAADPKSSAVEIDPGTVLPTMTADPYVSFDYKDGVLSQNFNVTNGDRCLLLAPADGYDLSGVISTYTSIETSTTSSRTARAMYELGYRAQVTLDLKDSAGNVIYTGTVVPAAQ